MGAKWRKHEASKPATATCCQTLSSGSFLSSILVQWRDSTLVVLVRFRGNNTRRSWQHNRLSTCTSTLDQADLAVFCHTPKHQNIKRTIWGTPSFRMFLFEDVYLHTIHIAYVLWLVSSIQNQNMFFHLFLGGWFVQGQTLDMSRSPKRKWSFGWRKKFLYTKKNFCARNKIGCSGWDFSL